MSKTPKFEYSVLSTASGAALIEKAAYEPSYWIEIAQFGSRNGASIIAHKLNKYEETTKENR